jgi:cold shock protein
VETVAIVREFDRIRGVGVVDSPDTPGGCWVHFSAIEVDGYKDLEPGEEVTLTFEPASQDGFSYRAIRVRKGAAHGLPSRPSPSGTGSAYSSELRINFPQ